MASTLASIPSDSRPWLPPRLPSSQSIKSITRFRWSGSSSNMIRTRYRKDTTRFPKTTSGLLRDLFRRSFHLSTSAPKPPPQAGDVIQLDGLGGEIEITDGEKFKLHDLIDISVGGVVLFIYPSSELSKASPRPPQSQPYTTEEMQICLSRDSCQDLRVSGFSIYGMSSDPPAANARLRRQYDLPYALVCNKDRKLIQALGFFHRAADDDRGVIAIDKDGRVLLTLIGTAQETMQAVLLLIDSETV